MDIVSLLVAQFGMIQWFINIPQLTSLNRTFNVHNSLIFWNRTSIWALKDKRWMSPSQICEVQCMLGKNLKGLDNMVRPSKSLSLDGL